MLDLLSLALLAAATPSADTVPTNISELETAAFTKPIYYAQRHEMAAERIAKKAGCKLPVDGQWVTAKVEAALLVSPSGELLKIIPVESQCQPLEGYTMRHLAKYAGKAGPKNSGSEARWYRTAMYFRWPE